MVEIKVVGVDDEVEFWEIVEEVFVMVVVME